MSRPTSLFIIAILVMVIPHLGLTNMMEQIILLVIGLIILIFAYALYFEKKRHETIHHSPVAPIKEVVKERKSVTRRRIVPAPADTVVQKREVPDITDTGFVVLKKRESNNNDEINNFNI